jgi:hypothetical protein
LIGGKAEGVVWCGEVLYGGVVVLESKGLDMVEERVSCCGLSTNEKLVKLFMYKVSLLKVKFLPYLLMIFLILACYHKS